MSRYLNAVEVLITTKLAIGVDHGGFPYTNPDVPIGSVFARDAVGDLYKLSPTMPVEGLSQFSGKMFRDYWTIVQSDDGCPYRDAIENALKTAQSKKFKS